MGKLLTSCICRFLMPLTISVMMTKKDFLLLARPISYSWIAWQQNNPVKDQQIRQDTSAELQGLAMWSQLKAADVTNSLQDLLVYEKKPSQNLGLEGTMEVTSSNGPCSNRATYSQVSRTMSREL